MYNAHKWQSINKTNQESTCTYSCAGQKLTALFSIHFYIKLFSLTLSFLYKTLAGYCTSIASQVRVTELEVRNARYLYKKPSVCFNIWTMPSFLFIFYVGNAPPTVGNSVGNALQIVNNVGNAPSTASNMGNVGNAPPTAGNAPSLVCSF